MRRKNEEGGNAEMRARYYDGAIGRKMDMKMRERGRDDVKLEKGSGRGSWSGSGKFLARYLE